jgi:D-glycero-D-manno-heptose 1,7-bisphosphate phosphatase
MKNIALFLDRDGVINVDYAYVHTVSNFHFVDGIFDLVCAARQANYLVVVVTNQAGIGRGHYTEDDFHALTNWMKEQFLERGGKIDGVYFCPYHAENGVGIYRKVSHWRKPEPGMLLQAAKDLDVDLARSIMIGDKDSDMQAASRAGIEVRCHFVANNKREVASCFATNTISSLLEAIPLMNKKSI